MTKKKKGPSLPKKVKIGPFTFKISWKAKDFELEDVMGECSASMRSIVVDPTYPLSAMQETLMHEIIHGCLGIFRLQFPTDSWENTDEFIASMLGVMIYGVLQDNPRIVEFLTYKD